MSMTTTCKTTFKVGDVLNNKWIILDFIGKGGMGEVYRAHQINLNRNAAIKVVSREWLESLDEGSEEVETVVQRFRREVQVMAQIRHPNILQVFDHDTIVVKKCEKDVSIEYIAMEYIPGGSLRETMPEEGFYPEEDLFTDWVKGYFQPVLAGVIALHDNGIVHRDLKPENILMDQHTPKIADFGLARSNRLKPVTQSMDMKGSPHYMSPEHFFDFKRVDQRADVYSLGKILFEAVEGKIRSEITPFKKAKLTKAESPFFKEIDQIIQRATTENRDERTESVRVLLSQIERVIHGLPSQKQDEKSLLQQSVPLSSKPTWIWTGIIVTLLLVMLMAIWHLMGEPGLGILKGTVSLTPSQRQSQTVHSHKTTERLTNIEKRSFTPEYLGTQHLIQGGTFSIPDVWNGSSDQTLHIKPFYMDEFFVTNQQFVDFLNHNLSQITIENGVVKGKGVNWFLLGEVRTGYEPIVYRKNRFFISNPAYASSPVLRVTGYGASAFAKYFGRRLPTKMEMFFVISKGANNSKMTTLSMEGMMRMMGEWQDENLNSASTAQKSNAKNNSTPKSSNFLLSAASFSPNLFGIKGLNHKIGEWVLLDKQGNSSTNLLKTNRYAVIGGVEGAPKDQNSLPTVVKRFPWEGFEEISFRTVKRAAIDNSAERARRQEQ